MTKKQAVSKQKSQSKPKSKVRKPISKSAKKSQSSKSNKTSGSNKRNFIKSEDGYLYPKGMEAIDIVPEKFDFPKECFEIPERFKPYVESILLPAGLIQSRWERIAARVIQDFKGCKELHIVTLMNGGYRFYEDLKTSIDAQLAYLKGSNVMRIVPHFVKVSSYKGINSTGVLKGAEQLEALPLQGKHVLLVEDMIDTGLTMSLILA